MITPLQRGFTGCCNCGNATKGRHNYRGVLVCSHCYSLALMCDRRAVKQAEQMLEAYREALRVSLASGKLKPARKIDSGNGEKVTPPTYKDLQKFLTGLAKVSEDSGSK